MAKPFDQLLKTAVDLHGAGRLVEADLAYAEALEIAPTNHTALLWSGVLANQQDRFADALDRLTASLGVIEDNPTAHLHLGIALNALGRSEEAVAAYRRAVALDPANPDGFNNLGVALEALGQPLEAADAYRRAINLNPANAMQHANLGNALRDAGLTAAALAAYEAAVKLDPADVWALNNLGTAQLYLGRLEDAVASYRRALALDPAFLPPRSNLCRALFDLRRLREAIQEYRAAIAQHPREKTLLLAFAQLLFETDAFLEARQIVERALALDPHYSEAHLLYASALDALGDEAAALRHREQALRRKSVYVEPFLGVAKRADVLMLACAGTGNLPTGFLLHPRDYGKATYHPQYPLGPGEAPPRHDLVFNIIADPDVAEAALIQAQAFVQNSDKPVLNHPSKVLLTRRHLIADRLSDLDGVVMPRTIEIDRTALLSATPKTLLAEMESFPFLIRPSGSHGGEDLEKIERVEDLKGYLQLVAADRFYLTRFVDYSNSEGLFRKYRVVFVEGRIYPLHLCIDRKWKAHYYTSLMRDFAWMRDEEARFLADIRNAFLPTVYEAATAVAHTLDLDYAGMDCSITRDGKLLVFEANANMLIHLNDPIEIFPYKHEYVPRVFDAIHAMIDRKLGRI